MRATNNQYCINKKHSSFQLVLGIAGVVIVLGLPGCVSQRQSSEENKESVSNAPRSKEWLENYLLQPIPNSPRKERYFKQIIENSADYCKLDEGFFVDTTKNTSYLSRSKSNALGCLAFCYNTPGLPYHKDPVALEKIRTAFKGMNSHVSSDGRFTWEENFAAYKHGSHEHAWRLEPLLIGYLWVKNDLSSSEQMAIEKSLKRAGRWLYENPNTEHNNRGVVSSAILALCGIYFEEPKWFDLAKKIGDEVVTSVIIPNGQIGEHTEQYAGGGPDINYSYTSLSYLYAYQLWTGADHLDALMEKGAHWLTGYNTLSQWPVAAGASVRTTPMNTTNFRDCLPFYEHLSKRFPYYALVSEYALSKVEGPGVDAFEPGQMTHIVSPAIWALLEGGKGVEDESKINKFKYRTETYSNPNVEYAYIGREYQTGLVFRARSGWKNDGKSLYRKLPAEGLPLRGLQTIERLTESYCDLSRSQPNK